MVGMVSDLELLSLWLSVEAKGDAARVTSVSMEPVDTS